MKLRLMICAAAASTALFATDDVMSDTYGVLAVSDTTTTNMVVGVPWVNIGEGNVTLSNLVSTATLENGDIVYLYEGNTWYGYQVTGDALVAMTTVNGQAVNNPSAADVKTLARGTGLIIQRAKITNPIYLCGRYDSTEPSATSVSADSTALIANPKTETVNITVGATGDQISVPGNGGTMNTYEKRSDGWYATVTDTTSFPFPVTQKVKLDNGVPLAAGKGAFYVNKGSSAVTINW